MGLFNNVITRICQKSDIAFNIIAFIVGFIGYSCVYAYRKPFLVAKFMGMDFYSIEYKPILVVFEVVGYACAKFMGIKFVPEMNLARRTHWIFGFVLLSEGTLILFGLIPQPLNALIILVHGFSNGLQWGLLFSFLEGRKTTEFIGSGMSVATVVASGIMKSIGQAFLDINVSPFWMPAIVGAIFFPVLACCVFVLESLPDPSVEDAGERTKRVKMDGPKRIAYFKTFWPGIIIMTFLYTIVAAYRDFRDNFTAELYFSMGIENASIFTISELIVGIIVIIPIACFMIFIPLSIWSLVAYHILIFVGMIVLLVCTILLDSDLMDPLYFMTICGISIYLAFVPFNSIIFDIVIALFKYPANNSFLMYISDAFGYLSSVVLTFIKTFTKTQLSWMSFFIKISYGLSIISSVLCCFSILYYYKKLQNWSYADSKSSQNIDNLDQPLSSDE